MSKDRVNLVDETHGVIRELAQDRVNIRTGKMDAAVSRNMIGIHNVTCRAINTAIATERWDMAKKLLV